MLNEKFWLAIAFTSFVMLIIKFVGPKITKSLDQKSKQIAEEILAAKDLRQKAQELLEAAEKYLIESEKFAKKLVQDAEEETQKFTENSKKNVQIEIEKKTQAALARMKLEEEIATREIKIHIVSSAIKILSEKITTNLDKKQHDHLIKQSTDDFSKLVH